MRIRKLHTQRGGTTCVEMAVVGPLTLLILFGIIDVGMAVWSYNCIYTAAREGARSAVVHGSKSIAPFGPTANDSALDQAVRNYAFGLASSNLTVTSGWPDGNNMPGSRMSVRLDYKYYPVSILQLGRFTLHSSTIMAICH